MPLQQLLWDISAYRHLVNCRSGFVDQNFLFSCSRGRNLLQH